MADSAKSRPRRRCDTHTHTHTPTHTHTHTNLPLLPDTLSLPLSSFGDDGVEG